MNIDYLLVSLTLLDGGPPNLTWIKRCLLRRIQHNQQLGGVHK